MTTSTGHGEQAERWLTEEDRVRRSRETGGEPILAFDAKVNPFAGYLNADVLHTLQNPRTKGLGEPAFLIMGQVMELLFKLSLTEVRQARDCLDADDVRGALWVLRRLLRSQEMLVHTWHVLSSLSPTEYAEFRDSLGEGSGFQSYMYRQLEFTLGNKNPRLLEPHRNNPAAYADVLRALHEPSLYDAALRLMQRHGLPIPQEHLDRDPTQPYTSSDEVVGAWLTVYREPQRWSEVYELGEALTDVAYQFGRWRHDHLLTVERILGHKVGTGGTSGVTWLRRIAEHRFFPELWYVRSDI
jgi:tryptophan 2,3-dioxygenase